MLIITNDGLTLSGTPEQILEDLRHSAFFFTDTSQYMRDVAARVRLWNRATITTDDARQFLYDLESAGLILLEE